MHAIAETCAVSSCHKEGNGLRRARLPGTVLVNCMYVHQFARYTQVRSRWHGALRDLDPARTIIFANTFLRSCNSSPHALAADDPHQSHQEDPEGKCEQSTVQPRSICARLEVP